MNRRDFLRYLLGTAAASYVDYEKLLWISEKTIFIPTHEQISFYGGNAGGGKTLLLYGIPYHYTDATTGTWLGISRE